MIVGWLAFVLFALFSGGVRQSVPPVAPSPLEAETFRIAPNFTYSVRIVTSAYRPNSITLQSIVLDDPGVSFALVNLTPDHFALAVREKGWGMAYVIYALNVQVQGWAYRYDEVGGTLMLSPDGQTLAFFICNISGGRGQWCSTPRLWFFSAAGEPRRIDLADYGILYFTEMRFSEDSRYLRADSCLKYLYPGYFGTCGVDAITTWDASTGDLFALSVIPASQ